MGLMSPGCWSLLTDFGIDLKPRAGGREGEIRRREDEGIMDPYSARYFGRTQRTPRKWVVVIPPRHWFWGISKASIKMPGCH
ncbi:hypothetical protein BO83DRAFT_246850 [Aspergillus eucalypticola CBS 122712]|uniref:Uncharacterized protein n=1 Tax=Aspergillus eucalypticola (strain CBS 122712 / IBT 29274) TaxID=1448314 RepID=A0A317VV99_ASPEC|nr:uncharacterized protein BO83DRAFT_246850 [Aspergillus eucalypticola CBS 122712]PWY75820.1 hypothetical protein BO83DRAFT_246850 [Aspergillus eucalypticola CBS 122712]